jgi:hypothetical protein
MENRLFEGDVVSTLLTFSTTQRGMIVGSIGIQAPLERFPKERYPECGKQVRAIANEISSRRSMEPSEE